MTEDYAAKMALKTDAALREYVTGHYQYREEAVLAALAELRARGQPAPEEAALRPGLEAGAAARRSQEAAAQAEAAPTPATLAGGAAAADGPALYSPTLIVLFSIFFNPVAGGVLLGLNLSRLGRWRGLVSLVIFLVSYFFLSRLAGQWAVAHLSVRNLSWVAPLVNLPAVLAYTLWFWPRYIGPGTFPTRPWLPPLLICVVVAFGLVWFTLKQQPPEVQQQFRQLLGQ